MWVKYNPNPAGRQVGDCAVRALTKALNTPRRDGMGRYSRAGSDMIHELRELMDDAPDDKTRQEFQRFIQTMEQM